MTRLSAPIFDFRDSKDLPETDSYLHSPPSGGTPASSFALTGPGATAEAGHLPVRGDLAHIKLAGRIFVPHYAVPMPHRVRPQGTVLRHAAGEGAEALAPLQADTVFEVLDIAGGWAWGQVGDDGLVGYVPLADLAGAGQ